MSFDGKVQVLAISDWESIAAVVVFTVISLIANWVKKRSEAEAGAQRPRKPDGDDEFESVELFDEPKPAQRSPHSNMPHRPPTLVVHRGQYEAPAGVPKMARALAVEAQERVGGTRFLMPKGPPLPGVSTRTPLMPASPPPDSREPEDAREKYVPDLHQRDTLRRAIIAAEILSPPIALRDPSQTFGHSC